MQVFFNKSENKLSLGAENVLKRLLELKTIEDLKTKSNSIYLYLNLKFLADLFKRSPERIRCYLVELEDNGYIERYHKSSKYQRSEEQGTNLHIKITYSEYQYESTCIHRSI